MGILFNSYRILNSLRITAFSVGISKHPIEKLLYLGKTFFCLCFLILPDRWDTCISIPRVVANSLSNDLLNGLFDFFDSCTLGTGIIIRHGSSYSLIHLVCQQKGISNLIFLKSIILICKTLIVIYMQARFNR